MQPEKTYTPTQGQYGVDVATVMMFKNVCLEALTMLFSPVETLFLLKKVQQVKFTKPTIALIGPTNITL